MECSGRLGKRCGFIPQRGYKYKHTQVDRTGQDWLLTRMEHPVNCAGEIKQHGVGTEPVQYVYCFYLIIRRRANSSLVCRDH